MTKGWGGLGALGRPNNLMDNHQKRQKLEDQLQTAKSSERRKILHQLAELGGRRGADTRPRGENSEQR